MTATTFTPANLQANTASVLAGNAASKEMKGLPAEAGDQAAPATSFGALFQQLMGKQTSPGLKPGLLDASPGLSEKVGANETADDLEALLPFLEAMGLVQSVDPGITPISPQAAPITPTVTPTPAITAGKGAIEFGNAPVADLASDTTPTTPAGKEVRGVGLGLEGEGSEAGQGSEFAAKLTAAIDSNKQAGQPNSMSSVVQQVIAANSPANTHAGAQAATMTIHQPVGEAGWSQELGQRIVWMANRAEGKAELILTPPQMGRVEVSLTVSGDQATASFASANPVVREALESALPRLREVLAEAGIQLGQAQVGAENAHQSAQQEKNPEKFAAHPETSASNSSTMAASGDSSLPTLKLGRGLVDVFA